MIQLYQHKAKRFLVPLFVLFTFLFQMALKGQTLSTAGAVNYGGLSRVDGTGGAVTFVVENATTQGRILSKIDCAVFASHTNNTYKLWYSSSSLSGQPSIAEPVWTLIKTGDPVSPSADGIITVLDNINFVIPGNTQYRFALTTDNGIRYTGITAGTPNPNTFSAGGLRLKVGSFQVNGAPVGWAGAIDNVVSNPRYFTGAVYITPCSSAISATVPVITRDTVICGENNPVTLRVISGNLNDAAHWKWYSGSCGGTLIDTGASVTISPRVNTTFFVRGEGGCPAPGSCASGAIAIRPKPSNPVIDTIAPICLGDLAHLQMHPFVTDTTPIPDSILVTAEAISMAIPDNTEDGIQASLTIPSLPEGARVTGIDVTLNLTHTYPGDMIIHLKAPNGVIANLYKYNGGTFSGNSGNMPNAGWFDAVTSSSGEVLYRSVDSPYRYTAGTLFLPDLINDSITGPSPTVQNPTGFISTATNLSQLYNIPAGTWTLALADGGPGDIGTLTGWAIKIKYNRFAQVPATPAVWTPGNNTLYVDAAATIAYDGTTPRLDVYAMPTATTVYTATSSVSGCNSDAVNTTVTVRLPASITTDISSTSVCENGSTGFAITASDTSATYQWQTDNGTGTFVDITDNNNYAGAATNTLSINNIPKAWDSYKYVCVVTSSHPCTQFTNSAIATLTVHPTPAVSLYATDNKPIHLLPGMNVTLAVAAAPAGNTYTWFKNSNVILNANTESYNVSIENMGIYKVSVIDVNGCSNTTNMLEISDSVSSKLFIYPNPSQNGKFSVSFHSLKNSTVPRTLTIYDSKGALVHQQSYTLLYPYDKMNVDFARLSKGVYLVNLLDRWGKQIAMGKLVVE